MVNEMRNRLDRIFILRGQLLAASILDKARLANMLAEESLHLLDAMLTELESLRLLAARLDRESVKA